MRLVKQVKIHARRGAYDKDRKVYADNVKLRAALEERAKREGATEADWDRPDDVAAWKRECRRAEREKRVRRATKGGTLVCPLCGKTREPRLWVLTVKPACCRSCFAKGQTIRTKSQITLSALTPLTARVASGLSKAEFARRCEWSAPFQHKLEKGTARFSERHSAVVVSLLKKLEVLADE